MVKNKMMSEYRRMVPDDRSLKRHQKLKQNIKMTILILFMIFVFITLLLLYRPVLRLNGSQKLEVKMGEHYTDLGAKAFSLGKDVSYKIKTIGFVNANQVGTYKIKYEMNYLNSTISKYRIVKVVDKTKPAIQLKGDKVIYLEQNKKYIEPGYNALDNHDGDVTKQVKVRGKVNSKQLGKYRIYYEVVDEAGNKAKVKRNVIIVKKQDLNLKTIYLTFDDGPSMVTPKILDILKEENVKATFFTIGKGEEYRDIYKRIVTEGHMLALHSNTHNYEQIYQSVDAYFDDLYTLQKHVQRMTGFKSNIIRFPGGASNTVSSFNPGIMSTLTAEVVKRHFYYFDWNIDSLDTGRIGSDAIVKNVTEALGNYHTYVVLMHDYGLNDQTADSLKRIIKYGKEHGYQFDKITEMTPAVHHGVNN